MDRALPFFILDCIIYRFIVYILEKRTRPESKSQRCFNQRQLDEMCVRQDQEACFNSNWMLHIFETKFLKKHQLKLLHILRRSDKKTGDLLLLPATHHGFILRPGLREFGLSWIIHTPIQLPFSGSTHLLLNEV